MTKRPRSDILTKEFLEECFVADFEAGTLTWKSRPTSHFKSDWAWKVWNKRFAGKSSGGVRSVQNRENYAGVPYVRIGGKCFRISRILMVMYSGGDTDLNSLEIDHIDRNPLNNSISNLRIVSREVNNINREFEGASLLSTGRWSMKFVKDKKEVVRMTCLSESLAKTVYKFIHVSVYAKESPYFPFESDLNFETFTGLTPRVIKEIESVVKESSAFLQFLKDNVQFNGRKIKELKGI